MEGEQKETKKTKKVLAHDPFADIIDSTTEEEIFAVAEPVAETASADAEEVAETEAAVSEPTVDDPAVGDFEDIAAELADETAGEGPSVTELLDAVEALEAELLDGLNDMVDFEVEAETMAAEADEAASLPEEEPEEADEAATHILDNLIAAIDDEIEALYGLGQMEDIVAVEQAASAGEERQYVIFSMAGTEYTVPIDNVVEIGRPLEITPVPNVPDWVLGVANLRGDIVSTVDLRRFLGLESTGTEQTSRMMVAQASSEEMSVALIVDRVMGIRFLHTEQIGAPTAPIEDRVAPYLHGVYEQDGRLLVVLDLDRLLMSADMQQFQPA